MNTSLTTRPARTAVPDASVALSPQTTPGGWLGQTAISVWESLKESGRRRAERQLLDFAQRCETAQPALAAELRAACCHH